MPNVIVVGAGIVGTACALALARAGHVTTLVDRAGPGQGCSFGPAALISPSQCMPLAVPGILGKVPGWLLRRDGRLCIRWRHLPALLPWLRRFAANATARQVAAAAEALRALHRPALALYDDMLANSNQRGLIRRDGQLFVYSSEASFRAAAAAWAMRRRDGQAAEALDCAGLRALEPALSPAFRHGILLHDHAHAASPVALVEALAALFVKAGGRRLAADVTALVRGPDGSARVATGGRMLAADAIVLAAGAWSAALVRPLGERFPLESERGYHAEIADAEGGPSRPVVNGDHAFASTPLLGGLRFAGTVEFAGLHAPPDMRRAQLLLRRGRAMWPGLRGGGVREWMGHRPSLPDSLPVIGRSLRAANLVYAFGHAHTGFTGAPMTAMVVSALVGGRPPPIDIRPFRPDRF